MVDQFLLQLLFMYGISGDFFPFKTD